MLSEVRSIKNTRDQKELFQGSFILWLWNMDFDSKWTKSQSINRLARTDGNTDLEEISS